MWRALPKPFFVLAPMADVTDLPFRSIVARCGRPDVFYTEFVSAHGLASPGRERLMLDLAITPSEHPVVAQFFGTQPEHIQAAGALARELGFDGVDINMGCPDRAIVKQGAGAALIRQPMLAQELIAALREGAHGLPIAVKTRIGFSRADEMEPWLSALLAAKPDALIIHGRTMKEMSAVPAHWDLIGRAVTMVHDAGVVCVGNGDVTSRRQGIELAERYGVDGIMVGRGIFQNTWFFNVEQREHSLQERIQLLLEHIELWEQQWNGVKSFDLMKKFFKMYISGWDGAAKLRAQLMETKGPDQVRALLTASSFGMGA